MRDTQVVTSTFTIHIHLLTQVGDSEIEKIVDSPYRWNLMDTHEPNLASGHTQVSRVAWEGQLGSLQPAALSENLEPMTVPVSED